jgi:hypothetical protein
VEHFKHCAKSKILFFASIYKSQFETHQVLKIAGPSPTLHVHTLQLPSVDKEILFNAYKLTIPLSWEWFEPMSAYGSLLRSYLRLKWLHLLIRSCSWEYCRTGKPGRSPEAWRRDDPRRSGNTTLKVLYYENRGCEILVGNNWMARPNTNQSCREVSFFCHFKWSPSRDECKIVIFIL